MGAQPGLGCRGDFPPQLCWAPLSLWGLGWLGTEDPKVVGRLLGITWSASQPELQASEFPNRLFTIKLFTLEGARAEEKLHSELPHVPPGGIYPGSRRSPGPSWLGAASGVCPDIPCPRQGMQTLLRLLLSPTPSGMAPLHPGSLNPTGAPGPPLRGWQ